METVVGLIILLTAVGVVVLEAVNLHPLYERYPNLGSYKLHTDRKSWSDAKQVCDGEGAYLAIVSSVEEADVFRKMLGRNPDLELGPGNTAFIGVYYSTGVGKFLTVFGQSLSSIGFEDWDTVPQASASKRVRCVGITREGKLSGVPCTSRAPFICERYHSGVNKTSVDSDAVNRASANGFTLYPKVGSYKLHMDAATWHDAKRICEEEDAHLAIVNSVKESVTLKQMTHELQMPELVLDGVLLGIHDQKKGKGFMTVFDEILETTGFNKWSASHLDSSDLEETCGALTFDGELQDVTCTHPRPYICERDIGLDRDDPAGTEAFTLYPGVGSYKLHMDAATWHEAKRTCEEEDAHLAIINSLMESATLRNIDRQAKIDLHGFHGALLGFHDISSEGNFITIFNDSLESTGFTRWFEGNPDNTGGVEDCGAMTHDGLLNDVPCTLRMPFFCERAIKLNPNGKSSRWISITPEHAHVPQGSIVSIMCQSDQPLVECHFKMMNLPVFDLSLGENLKVNASHLKEEISMYRYNGSGLEDGQCGIVLSLAPGIHRKIVGCRGRAVRGGWKYGYMSLQASNSTAVDKLSVPPREFYATLNQDVHLLWQTPTPVTMCKFTLPSMWVSTVFINGSLEGQSRGDAPDSSEERSIFFGRFRPDVRTSSNPHYLGQGLGHGDCGVSLPASPRWNGFVWCGLGDPLQPTWEWRAVAVIVPQAPDAPTLQVNAAEHSEGAILEAECVVSGARPVANITWYLGDDVIRQDDVEDSITDTWRWPYDEQTITQKLTRQLKAEDNGKKLICEASHWALPTGTLRSSKPIIVDRSILNRTFDVDEYGFEVGKQGFISVIVTASPRPVLIWHFNDVTIQEGGQDPTGRYFAAQAVQTTSQTTDWVAKLIITNVTEEDFKTSFTLTTKNMFRAQSYLIGIHRGLNRSQQGQKPVNELSIQMHKNPQPTASTVHSAANGQSANSTTTVQVSETTESDSMSGGAIAGIVITILMLLITLAAIFVYGRRSGWWCIPSNPRVMMQTTVSMDDLVNEDTVP